VFGPSSQSGRASGGVISRPLGALARRAAPAGGLARTCAAGVLAFAAFACGSGKPETPPFPAPKGSASEAATPAAAAGSSQAPEPARLVARWIRTDSPYTIAIESATPEGKLAARYLNPGPINVSRAEWRRDAGRLALLVELNDRGYPGSYYELKFDPGSDTLYGVYHHLGLGQDFDVSFTRQAKGEGGL